MKKILKRTGGALAAAMMLMTAASAADDAWMHDLDEALALAATEKKPVMAEFTGSDWCPPCKMMAEKVFSKPEFTEAASKDFILVKVDIPRGDPELSKKNRPYMQKYSVRGVPTVILFSPEGTEFSRFTASAFPSVEKFLEKLKTDLAKKDMQ